MKAAFQENTFSPRDRDFEQSNWMRDVPKCKRNFGTIALLEQEADLQGLTGAQNATPALRYLIQKSGCFTVVDRGPAIAKFDAEHAYAGKEPVARSYRPMDYLLTAKVVFQESRSSDGMASAAKNISSPPTDASSFGVNFSVSSRVIEVNAVLLLTDVRSTVQVLSEQGSAAKTDVTFNTFFAIGFETLSSKTTAAALYDAYARMVAQLNESKLGMKTSRRA